MTHLLGHAIKDTISRLEGRMWHTGSVPPSPPLNDYAPLLAFSMRKLRANYAGQCLRLRRDSDDAQSDFGFDASGNLDVGAIVTWLGGANGFCTIWYDQGGGGRNAINPPDLAGITKDQQPTYHAGFQNGHPALGWTNAAATLLYTTSAYTQAQPFTAFTVSQFSSFVGNPYVWADVPDGLFRAYFRGMTAGTVDRMNAGSNLNGTAMSINTTYLHSHLFNGASSIQRRNATQTAAGNAGTNSIIANVAVQPEFFIGSPGDASFNGKIMELFILDGNQGVTTLEASINSYWAIY